MTATMTIDGSFGEGGGQVVRSALGLSMVTKQPFRIENIRAGRKTAGLMHQHLTAVQAAAEISGAKVTGDVLGSRTLTFQPGKVTPGQYAFSVGTAGSATLVLQTVLPALMTGAGSSELTLRGGTHNPWSPPFDFIHHALLPLLNRMGPRITAGLERAGFYPAGGGEFRVRIEPAERLTRVDLLERGEVVGRRATAMVANLPERIAERELKVVRDRLGWPLDVLSVETVKDSPGPGNVVMIQLACEHITEVFTGFGQRHVRAETVAAKAAGEVREYLSAAVPVGKYLADQLLVPLALTGGRFRTVQPTRHTETNIELIKMFLDVHIACTQIDTTMWEIDIDRA